jgi:hypothetical protein
METQERLHVDHEVHRPRKKKAQVRDYAYEALSEVTSTDQNVGRGALNAALRDIRAQEPELTDSYLLSAEIHERAKMYRTVFANAALTPNALAKHWQRVKAETNTRPKMPAPPSLPARPARERNLEEARKILAKLKGEA